MHVASPGIPDTTRLSHYFVGIWLTSQKLLPDCVALLFFPLFWEVDEVLTFHVFNLMPFKFSPDARQFVAIDTCNCNDIAVAFLPGFFLIEGSHEALSFRHESY